MGRAPLVFPATTMIGALCGYVSSPLVTGFQPMKPNFGLLPEIELPLKKADKRAALCARALADLEAFMAAEMVEG